MKLKIRVKVCDLVPVFDIERLVLNEVWWLGLCTAFGIICQVVSIGLQIVIILWTIKEAATNRASRD